MSERAKRPRRRGKLIVCAALAAVGSTIPISVPSQAADGPRAPGSSCSDPLPGHGGDRCEAWISLHGAPPEAGEENLYGEYANDVAIAPDGSRVFVTGLARIKHDGDPLQIFRNSDLTTIAYAPEDGRELWRSSLDLGGYEEGYVVAAGPGVVVVSARAEDAAGENDIMTVAYEASTGIERWRTRLKGSVDLADLPADIAFSTSGDRVFLTGEITSSGLTDYATVAYDAASGQELWSGVYDGSDCPVPRDLRIDQPRGLVVGLVPDEGDTVREVVFVTGRSGGCGTGLDYATLAYDADSGERLWEARHHAGFGDEAKALALAPGGVLYVTGTVQVSDRFDVSTVAYGAETGELLWESRYDGPSVGNHDDSGEAVVVLDDRVVVAARSETAQDPVLGGFGDCSDIALLAYDKATGAERWTRRHDGPGFHSLNCHTADTPTGLIASPAADRVFVTGMVSGSALFSDATTLALRAADGSVLWTGRYDGPDHVGAAASSIVSNPTGSRVFVTGGAGAGGNFATLAYDA